MIASGLQVGSQEIQALLRLGNEIAHGSASTLNGGVLAAQAGATRSAGKSLLHKTLGSLSTVLTPALVGLEVLEQIDGGIEYGKGLQMRARHFAPQIEHLVREVYPDKFLTEITREDVQTIAALATQDLGVFEAAAKLTVHNTFTAWHETFVVKAGQMSVGFGMTADDPVPLEGMQVVIPSDDVDAVTELQPVKRPGEQSKVLPIIVHEEVPLSALLIKATGEADEAAESKVEKTAEAGEKEKEKKKETKKEWALRIVREINKDRSKMRGLSEEDIKLLKEMSVEMYKMGDGEKSSSMGAVLALLGHVSSLDFLNPNLVEMASLEFKKLDRYKKRLRKQQASHISLNPKELASAMKQADNLDQMLDLLEVHFSQMFDSFDGDVHKAVKKFGEVIDLLGDEISPLLIPPYS